MNISAKQYGDLLAHYIKPQKGRVAWLAITLLSSIGLQLLNPQILGYFIDTTVAQTTNSSLWAIIVLLLVVDAGQIAVIFAGRWTKEHLQRYKPPVSSCGRSETNHLQSSC
jgi:ABC-type multidrug transport system fused ATPase/permease subunit